MAGTEIALELMSELGLDPMEAMKFGTPFDEREESMLTRLRKSGIFEREDGDGDDTIVQGESNPSSYRVTDVASTMLAELWTGAGNTIGSLAESAKKREFLYILTIIALSRRKVKWKRRAKAAGFRRRLFRV
jgi:hypothetical protein